MGLPPAPFIAWPEHARWYLLGRHALIALLRSLPDRLRRLWVPSYFCFDVAEYWKSFLEVRTYSDDPRSTEPDWSTICPAPDDLVLAVNYFGVRRGGAWTAWRARNECVLVEDHSHDPVSGWALHSDAAYAFASLRKTLPVPDGAVLWSPLGLPLPENGTSENAASAAKLAAMLWKRDYLAGYADPKVKAIYRAWQQEGEAALDRAQVSLITGLSREYVSPGVPAHWRKRRARNARRLLTRLQGMAELRPIFSSWPKNAAPLGIVVEFGAESQRNLVRRRLQEYGVYCPVHWPAIAACDPAARDLASRLLTIPTDQRYGSKDMDKIAAFLTNHSSSAG
jgi:hypothetical protein